MTGAPGVKRLKPIPLGPRNKGFLESELDALIDALAALRDAQPAGAGKKKNLPQLGEADHHG